MHKNLIKEILFITVQKLLSIIKSFQISLLYNEINRVQVMLL